MLGIDKFLNYLADRISDTIRVFTAYSMILFFIGGIFGFSAVHLAAKFGLPVDWLLVAPLALAIFAYYVTEIAFVLFLLLMILFLGLLL